MVLVVGLKKISEPTVTDAPCMSTTCGLPVAVETKAVFAPGLTLTMLPIPTLGFDVSNNVVAPAGFVIVTNDGSCDAVRLGVKRL